jgi:ABC-type uncharacterized transport system permease subunit
MINFIASVLITATPLAYAALAGVLAARVGIWHLGLGGIMSMGGFLAVLALSTGLGLLPASLMAVFGSVCLSLVMWAAIVKLRANAILVGIGINMLGLGGTILLTVALKGAEGSIMVGEGLPTPIGLPGLSRMSILVWLMPLIVIAMWVFICRSRFGLRLSATGDDPFAARSVGVKTSRTKLVALSLGGVLCALAGMELALGTLSQFTPGMEAGRGLIAFAAVVLGASNPIGAGFAALAFGVIDYAGIWAQLNLDLPVPDAVLLMLPYLATIVIITLTTSARGGTETSPSEISSAEST